MCYGISEIDPIHSDVRIYHQYLLSATKKSSINFALLQYIICSQ